MVRCFSAGSSASKKRCDAAIFGALCKTLLAKRKLHWLYDGTDDEENSYSASPFELSFTLSNIRQETIRASGMQDGRSQHMNCVPWHNDTQSVDSLEQASLAPIISRHLELMATRGQKSGVGSRQLSN